VFPGANSGLYTVEEVQDMDEKDVTPAHIDQPPAPPPPTALTDDERADHLAAIDAAADLDSLKRAFGTAYSHAKMAADVGAITVFEKAKDARKTALTEAA
jgi:hypothetical protein